MTANHKKNLITGAAWAVASRWVGRALGLISTSILARILQPQDYGIVAMAFLVVGLVATFLDTGAAAALVRLGSSATIQQINSAWTLRGIQGVLMSLVLAILAPLAAIFFNEPRLLNVLLIVAVCQALVGFSNIGMTIAYRDLSFLVEFKQSVYTKFSSITVTICASLYFVDYRGLVCGIVGGFIVELILSYKLHPYRPQWCTASIGELWKISKWLLVTGVGSFFLHRSDQFIAGRISSTQQFGLYTVGSDIGLLPTGELSPSLTRPLFPILTAMKEDWGRAKLATLKALGSVNSITMPLGFGLAAVSDDLTLLLLGSQWQSASPFVAGFAVIGVIQYLMSPLNVLLNVAGYVRVQSRSVWIELLSFAVFSLILAPVYHLQGLMIARIISCIVYAALMVHSAYHYSQLSPCKVFGVLVRPLSGAVFMYVILVNNSIYLIGATISLICNIAFGAVFYTLWLLVTWLLSCRPDGLEKTVIEFIQRKIKRVPV